MLADLIASGRVVDAIIAFMAAEAVALLVYRRIAGRGPGAADIGVMLLAGLCLLLALRAALTGAGWAWVAAFLAAALVSHLADLALRFRNAARSG